MKKPILALIPILLVTIGCTQSNTQTKETQKLPRIAIAGIGIESSTFSPAQTHEEAFHSKIGDSIFGRYSFFDES